MGGHVPAGSAQMLAEAVRAASPRRVAIVCVNVGPKYGMGLVEVLRDMVARHLTESEDDIGFFCLTDRAGELPDGVNAIPAPEGLPGWWAKVALFSPDMPFEPGQRIVYFDLDVCITGRLEDLLDTPGIIKDWAWPGYNSSVMVWDHGEHRAIWDRFTPERMTAPGSIVPAHLLPAGQPNAGDQEWTAEVSEWPLLPETWCRSWRWDERARSWPPEHCKVVVFHGQEKPWNVHDGWVPNLWKVGGLTAFPIVRGVNTAEDKRLDNVRSAVQRDLPWFTGFKDEGKTCVLVCGAPSMRDNVAEIRAHKKRGARIVSVNASWRFLAENGITPDVNVMVDARPGNVDLVQGAPDVIRWLIASQCHPDLFDALADREVVVWHSAYDAGAEKLREILAPFWDEDSPIAKPCLLVPGGSTVGLRTLWLATFSGFRTIHVYGADSSYADDGSHHAYAQSLNDQEQVVTVERKGKSYRCSAWMIRQAAEFTETWNDLRNWVDPVTGKPDPVTIHVHGAGLLPDIARDLREEARAA